jgi:hypothetical protein
MRRTQALMLFALGYLLIASLSPVVAFLPAFGFFLAAGLLLAQPLFEADEP